MRFRFTIRDLLWLTAVVAMGIGWWLDRRETLPWERPSSGPYFDIVDSPSPDQ